VLATALRAYAVFKSAFLIMLVSILTPLTFRFFAEPGFEQTLIGLCLIVYGIPMALYMWRSHHAIVQSLRLVLVNEALVRHLSESKKQVEQLNLDLLATQEEIRKLALHDPLTGVANRLLLTDRLDKALASAHRHGRMLGLLFIDLDGFKLVNDELGHQQGDLLLIEVAERLRSALRENDTVARIGGDEFVILLEELHAELDADQRAAALLCAITRPIRLKDRGYQIGASIGISVYPRDGADQDALLSHADHAMYGVKRSGGNSVNRDARRPVGDGRQAWPDSLALAQNQAHRSALE
jgi:diguanylate cyclase (GGDEF)-like protein